MIKNNILYDQIMKEFEKNSGLPRKHAAFFNWYDKKVKESGIVDEFLDERNHQGAYPFTSFSVPENDPPDVLLYDNNKNVTALEITELVNQKAIEAQILNKAKYVSESMKWADPSYFGAQINEKIQIKQQKCLNLFESKTPVHLLFYTDELWLESCLEDHLNNEITIIQNSFSIIWLMLSYSTHTQSCPIIKLWQKEK
jgi:hypothetical protein